MQTAKNRFSFPGCREVQGQKAAPLFFLILAFSAVLVFFSIEEGHSWGDDFSLYIRQIKALLEGNIQECLASNARSMADGRIGPDLYRWGFPFLLAPVYYFFGMDLFAMKLLEAAFFYLSLLAIYLLFRKRLDRFSALFIFGFFAFNPFFIKFTNNILSDLPGLFFCLFSVFLIDKFVIEKKCVVNRAASFLLLGLFIWAAFFIRRNYIILIPTLFLCQCVEMIKSGNIRDYLKENRSAILSYAVFLILILICEMSLPKTSWGDTASGVKEVASAMANKYGNFFGNLYYTALLPSKMFGTGHTIQRALYFLSLPFAVKGIRLVWKKDYLFVIFFVFTFILFAIWPARQGLRYVFALLPFYVYFFLSGLNSIKFKKRFFNADLSRLFLCVLLSFLLMQSSSVAYQNIKAGRQTEEGPFTSESKEMFRFISENTKEKEVMVFFKPRALMLLIDRQAFLTVKLNSAVEKGDYLIINKRAHEQQVSTKGADFKEKMKLGVFTQIFENNGFVVYRINRTF